jgi:signal transduction histidine kinase
MKSGRAPIVVFGLGAALVLAALGWVTRLALGLEQREQEARAEAKFQESVRLVLWRMDAAITPLIAREAARPYFHYQSFYPADRAYTRMLNRVEPDEVLVPSPLLRTEDPMVRLHFQKRDGAVTSPEVPEGELRTLAESVYVGRYGMLTAEQGLERVARLLGTETQEKKLAAANDETAQRERAEPPAQMLKSEQKSDQVKQSENEYAIRQQSADTFRNIAPQRRSEESQTFDASTSPAAEGAALSLDELKDKAAAGEARSGPMVDETRPAVIVGDFVALWAMDTGPDPELLFTRDVRLGDSVMKQGFWLDWPALRESLLALAKDLLPGASLRPVLTGAVDAPDALGRTLAAIPAELIVDQPPIVLAPGWSPIRTTLAVTWSAALLALVAIAFVLRASLELAERRGRFVSAVTHELRTPLTTFCLYSQMLADGMVRDDEARRGYFATLKTESQRLARIVESVLDFARLGGGRAGNGRVRITLGDLLDRSAWPLTTRAEQSGMTLEIAPDVPRELPLYTDPATVERILYNLVDNACKYAGASDDKRIELKAESTGDGVVITVRDHGPGVPKRDQRSIFRPFVRGTAQGDGSIPGLGLGLALSRGLAKQLGGELRLAPSDTGAEFRLTFPQA